MRLLSPTGSYVITVPDEAVSEVDGRVTSIWLPGESVALQLSSLVRQGGRQVDPRERLAERLKRESVADAVEFVLDLQGADVSAASFVGSDGLYWVYAYGVWADLTVFATVSGSPSDFVGLKHWSFEAIRSIVRESGASE